VLGQAKAHGGVLLQTQKMCEDCGAKHAHYGTSKAALLSVEDFAEDGRGFAQDCRGRSRGGAPAAARYTAR